MKQTQGKTIIYNKLVRDNIPDIIEANGMKCICTTLSDSEYVQKLDEKLSEELAEYQESKSLEELADLLEVLKAVINARGWTWEKLEQVRSEKSCAPGRFLAENPSAKNHLQMTEREKLWKSRKLLNMRGK